MQVNLSRFHLSAPLVKALFAAVSALLILIASTYIFFHKEVSVTIDGRVKRFMTRAGTVGQLLAEADIDVSPRDQVTPGLENQLDPDDHISVKHAIPVVLEVNGRRQRIWTTAANVGAVVENDLGIALDADIKLNPEANTKIAANQAIELLLLTRWTEKTQAEIAFSVQRQDNNRLAKGRTRVLTKGRPGVKETVIEHVRAGDREIEKIVRAERVVSQPVAEVVSVGTMVVRARVAAASIPSFNVSRSGRSLTMVATAYASGTGGAGWRTATGTGVHRGIVAVDPRVIPLGTRLYIDGYGPAVAADTGGAIRGNRIDLGFGSAGEAIQFGRRSVVVYIQ